ncbi:acetolactate decarboxylase [Legionella nagasakiensis]|uniref:acetolactate decarboxylase n=1 Tax=Legionella nagasakiensis TaxID=535290 RepID=UPI001054482A|nr:acetolactate decarboxylase [Legionella nagasakiensis]
MSTLYQYSHFLAVTNGCYDGNLSIKELKKHGNIGLGTFNSLDGELVVVNNNFYHCSNGCVRVAFDHEMLPWAAVTNFQSEKFVTINDISSISELELRLLAHFPSKNYPIALYIESDVENIALGSVPKQKRPYKPILQVIDESIFINTGRINAKIVGFYAPGFIYPIKSNGIHLHFIDKNICIGGHILDLNLISAKIYWQQIDALNVIFPQFDEYKHADLKLDIHSSHLPKFEDKLKRNHKME